MAESILVTFQQWVLFSGVALAVGCVAWRGVVAPRASRMIATDTAALREIERRVASLGAITALALMGAWVLRMVVQIMGFRDPFVPLSEDVSLLLFETFWGTVWMAQGVVLGLLTVAFWRAGGAVDERAESGTAQARDRSPRTSMAWRVAGALVLMLVATLALSSHAMGVKSGRSLIVAADGIHALAAGSWIGSLGIILTLGRPDGRSGDNRGLFAAQLHGFSPLALASVSALVGMGVVLAWAHLHGVTNLWATSYGRILSAKIGVAVSVFAMGAWNWRRGLAACDTAEGAAAVRRRAAWEVSLAAGVLLLTAVLVHMPKP